MRSITRTLVSLLTVGAISAAVVAAPVAAAAPQCTNVGPTTTQCQTNGSSQIVTSPPVINNWGGWPYWGGGIVISLGGL